MPDSQYLSNSRLDDILDIKQFMYTTLDNIGSKSVDTQPKTTWIYSPFEWSP